MIKMTEKIAFDDVNDFKINKNTEDDDEISLRQESELKAAMQEMNKDSVDPGGYTDIDTKSRLSTMEIGSILTLDTWVRMGALPFECLALSRGRKRLNVSINGLGRSELRDMAVADRDRKIPAPGGFMTGLKSMFGMKPNE